MNVDGTLGAKSEKLVKFARCYGAQAVGSDARLISPAGLVDAFLKAPHHTQAYRSQNRQDDLHRQAEPPPLIRATRSD